jgi:hypothetical protein
MWTNTSIPILFLKYLCTKLFPCLKTCVVMLGQVIEYRIDTKIFLVYHQQIIPDKNFWWALLMRYDLTCAIILFSLFSCAIIYSSGNPMYLVNSLFLVRRKHVSSTNVCFVVTIPSSYCSPPTPWASSCSINPSTSMTDRKRYGASRDPHITEHYSSKMSQGCPLITAMAFGFFKV